MQHQGFSPKFPLVTVERIRGELWPKRTRIRLPNEAYDILNDYFFNSSERPNVSARISLAERLRQIPGCEHYTPLHVYTYFANLRRRFGGSNPRKSTPDPLQALAADSVERKLDALLRENADPSPEVAGVWAEKLGGGVTPEYILTYAFLWASQIVSHPLSEAAAQLATPDPSLSPKLHSSVSHPLQVRSETKKLFQHGETQTADTIYTGCERAPVESVRVTPPEAGTAVVNMTGNERLAGALRIALGKSQGAPDNIPRTFAELSSWIEDMGGAATTFMDMEDLRGRVSHI